jgi:hypothetical protein
MAKSAVGPKAHLFIFIALGPPLPIRLSTFFLLPSVEVLFLYPPFCKQGVFLL